MEVYVLVDQSQLLWEMSAKVASSAEKLQLNCDKNDTWMQHDMLLASRNFSKLLFDGKMEITRVETKRTRPLNRSSDM